MGTAIGIALFLAVYGRIGFMVYEELTGRQRSRVKPPRAAASGEAVACETGSPELILTSDVSRMKRLSRSVHATADSTPHGARTWEYRHHERSPQRTVRLVRLADVDTLAHVDPGNQTSMTATFI